MPRKVSIDEAAFGLFSEKMRALGFRRVEPVELSQDFARLGLVAPRPRRGKEVGFSFAANGLEVRVWTTFLASLGHERDSDEGWVLIKQGDSVRYFSRPMHRTEHFLRRLYERAQIARLRVINRPLCPECRARMQIAFGEGLKSRFYICKRTDRHVSRRPICCGWDYGLPPKALEFVRKERKRRSGTGAALRKRRAWKAARPENRES